MKRYGPVAAALILAWFFVPIASGEKEMPKKKGTKEKTVWVKICGVKRPQDAKIIVDAGADAVGFLVGQKHTSTDFISKERAREMIAEIPSSVTSVLVTHLTSSEEIEKIVRFTGAGAVQLHSEILPKEIMKLREILPGKKFFKSYHVTGSDSLSYGEPYVGVVDVFVLDSVNRATGQVGGTGKTHDWTISRKIVRKYDLPVILAGGLDPENVQDAIERVHPYGVDVNSGTKAPDGFKDPSQVRRFIQNAKKANR